MMRPLSVIQTISSPWWTGAAEPALSLTVDLAGRGHRVHFVCCGGERLEEEAAKAGRPRVEGLEPTRSLNPVAIGRSVASLAGFIDRVEPDIIHSHLSADHWISFLAAKLARRPVRLVRTFHHPRAARRNPASRYFLVPSTDALIVANGYIADLLRRGMSVPEERLHVVPGGVDLDRFRPGSSRRRETGRRILGAGSEAFLIGIVSRLAPDRGHMTLFDGFKMIAAENPGARLVVVGKGEHLSRLEGRVRALGLEDRVDFTGYRESDLTEILSALDVFTLMAPGSEGTCRAVLEAMAMGLPCVVADCRGLAEVVEGGVTAEVVPPDAPEALAVAFRRLMGDAALRDSYGKEGRRRAEKCYARRRRAEDVEAVYAGLMGAVSSKSKSLVG